MTQPYQDPRSGWRFRALVDYANSAELNDPTGPTEYVLDGEFFRLDLIVSKDIGKHAFVIANGSLNGAYSGFLDGFLNWYHDFIGIPVPARSEKRPENEYLYRIRTADGTEIERGRSGAFLGDLRLGAGWRHTRHWQSSVAITLPTSTGPSGFGRGVPSFNAMTTVRTPFAGRWTYEGTAGLGITPSHDDGLERFQQTTFAMVSSGLRWRFSGQQAMFGNVIYQSSQYHNTGLRGLDNRDITIDFGWLLRIGDGPEWQLGITEDLEPNGPALDLSFRMGIRY